MFFIDAINGLQIFFSQLDTLRTFRTAGKMRENDQILFAQRKISMRVAGLKFQISMMVFKILAEESHAAARIAEGQTQILMILHQFIITGQPGFLFVFRKVDKKHSRAFIIWGNTNSFVRINAIISKENLELRFNQEEIIFLAELFHSIEFVNKKTLTHYFLCILQQKDYFLSFHLGSKDKGKRFDHYILRISKYIFFSTSTRRWLYTILLDFL